MNIKKLLSFAIFVSVIFYGCAPSSETNNQKSEKKEDDNGGGNPLMAMMGGGGGGGSNPMGGMMGGGDPMGGMLGGMSGMGGGAAGGMGGGQGGGGQQGEGGQQKIVSYYKTAYIGIANIDYQVNGYDFTTNYLGAVRFNKEDKKIDFSIGRLYIGSVDVSKIDRVILPPDLFGLRKDNVSDNRVIKTLILLESIDKDNNLSNGIQISSYTKDIIDNLIENEEIKTNLIDNNYSVLEYMIKEVGKTPIPKEKAIKNYELLLKDLKFK